MLQVSQQFEVVDVCGGTAPEAPSAGFANELFLRRTDVRLGGPWAEVSVQRRRQLELSTSEAAPGKSLPYAVNPNSGKNGEDVARTPWSDIPPGALPGSCNVPRQKHLPCRGVPADNNADIRFGSKQLMCNAGSGRSSWIGDGEP